MLVHDMIVAIAPNPKSCESFYIKITKEEKEKTEDEEDGFGYVIKKEMKKMVWVTLGMKHLEGVF